MMDSPRKRFDNIGPSPCDKVTDSEDACIFQMYYIPNELQKENFSDDFIVIKVDFNT